MDPSVLRKPLNASSTARKDNTVLKLIDTTNIEMPSKTQAKFTDKPVWTAEISSWLNPPWKLDVHDDFCHLIFFVGINALQVNCSSVVVPPRTLDKQKAQQCIWTRRDVILDEAAVDYPQRLEPT